MSPRLLVEFSGHLLPDVRVKLLGVLDCLGLRQGTRVVRVFAPIAANSRKKALTFVSLVRRLQEGERDAVVLIVSWIYE